MPDAARYSLILVSHSYPPVLGGSEIEAQRVCSALIRHGHSVTVLCAGGPPMPETRNWLDPAGVPVRILARRFSGRARDVFFGLSVVWQLLRSRRETQLVYFLMQGFHLAVGLPAARLLDLPIVMKVSGSNIITLMGKSRLGRLELGFLRRWAHRVMILNSAMAEEATRAGFEPKHLLWMPNPVDTAEFAPCPPEARPALRANLNLPQDSPTAVFVGRLAPEKELPSLLQAFAITRQAVPNATLVLIGDGPERPALEALAESLKISAAVRFAGRLAIPQLIPWLQAADVFTLVSSLEGFPCSLVEAMSAGLPALASSIPANTQLVEDGVHGLLAPPKDVPALAAALTSLLQMPEARRQEMAAAARQRVLDNYSTEKVVDRYEALFAEAIKG